MVKQIAAQVDVDARLADHAPAQAVVQLPAVQLQALACRQQAFVLVEQALHGQYQAAVTNDLAATVGELIGTQPHAGLAGDFTLLVENARAVQVDATGGSDEATVAVIQGGAGKTQHAFADQFAGLLVEHTDGCQQVALGADPPGAVFDLTGAEGQAAVAAQSAASAVVQAGQFDAGIGLAADHALLAIVDATAAEGHCPVGNHQAALVGQRITVQYQGVFTRYQPGLGVIELADTDLLGALADQVALVVVIEQPGDVRGQVALAGDGALAAVVQAGGLQGQQAGGREDPQAVVDRAAGEHIKVGAQQFAGAVIQGGGGNGGLVGGDFACLVAQ